jgi:hypothetical protein
MAYKKVVLSKYYSNINMTINIQKYKELEEDYEELLRENQILQMDLSLYLSNQKRDYIENTKLKEDNIKLYEDNKRLYEEYKLNNINKKKYVNNIYTNAIIHTTPSPPPPSPPQPPSLQSKSINKQKYVRKHNTSQQKADKQERMKIAREKKVLIKQKNLIHLENIRARKQIRDRTKQEKKRKELVEQDCTITNIHKKVKIEIQDEILTSHNYHSQHPTHFLCDSDITDIIEDTIVINFIDNTDDTIVCNLDNDNDDDNYNSDVTETDDELIKPIDTYTQANQLLNFPTDPFPIEYTYVADILFSSSNMQL